MQLAPFFVIFESEIHEIVREAAAWTQAETGGSLFGYATHSGLPVIHFALGPGPGADRARTRCRIDARYLQQVGTELSDNYGLQHIGAWHSHHHLGLEHPSSGDLEAMQEALGSTGCERLALIIASLQPGGRPSARATVTLRPFLYRSNTPAGTECSWVVLPGVSPIRRQYEAVRAESAEPWTPWQLTPRALTMSELRSWETAPRVKLQFDEALWYVHPEGQQRLRAERQAFDQHTMPVEIELDSHQRLLISVPTAEGRVCFRLPPGYPGEAPEAAWLSPTGEETPLELSATLGRPWDAGQMLLADVHRRIAVGLPPAPVRSGPVEAGTHEESPPPVAGSVRADRPTAGLVRWPWWPGRWGRR
jgi:hypothetical protein